MTELLFYVFSAVLVFSSIMVITLRNPVHSVLFLIFSFFNAAALFIMLGAEFIAMNLIIVYVGAVAVLFLFVVMMLNIKIETLKQGFWDSAPLGIGLSIAVFLQLVIAFSNSAEFLPKQPEQTTNAISNTHAIGAVLYTEYFIPFQIAGLILLVAIVGSIVLTLTHDKNAKRQNICKQVIRSSKESVLLAEPIKNKGVEI